MSRTHGRAAAGGGGAIAVVNDEPNEPNKSGGETPPPQHEIDLSEGRRGLIVMPADGDGINIVEEVGAGKVSASGLHSPAE